MEYLTRKRAHAQFTKTVEEDGELYVEGVASTASIDRSNESVDQKSLADAVDKYHPRILFHQHNWDAPLGKVVGIKPTSQGLWVRSLIGRDYEIPVLTPRGVIKMSVNNMRTQIKQGIMSAYSIGFNGEREEDDEGNVILRVKELYEISGVYLPANRDCLFSVAKAFAGSDLVEMEQGLNFEFEDDLFERSFNSISSIVKPESGAELDRIKQGVDECLIRLKKS